MFEQYGSRPSGSLLDALTDVDPGGLDLADQVEYLSACAKVEARVVALKMLVIESIARAQAV